MSIRPEDQYNKIISGLNAGQRIAYNRRNKRFEAISQRKAEREAATYETDLIKVKEEICKYITEFGISNKQQKILTEALENRAQDLEGRWFKDEKTKTKQAKNLRDIKSAIDETVAAKAFARAAARQREKIPSHVPPSTPGPQEQSSQVAAQSETPLISQVPTYEEASPVPPPTQRAPKPGMLHPPPSPQQKAAKIIADADDIVKKIYEEADARAAEILEKAKQEAQKVLNEEQP